MSDLSKTFQDTEYGSFVQERKPGQEWKNKRGGNVFGGWIMFAMLEAAILYYQNHPEYQKGNTKKLSDDAEFSIPAFKFENPGVFDCEYSFFVQPVAMKNENYKRVLVTSVDAEGNVLATAKFDLGDIVKTYDMSPDADDREKLNEMMCLADNIPIRYVHNEKFSYLNIGGQMTILIDDLRVFDLRKYKFVCKDTKGIRCVEHLGPQEKSVDTGSFYRPGEPDFGNTSVSLNIQCWQDHGCHLDGRLKFVNMNRETRRPIPFVLEDGQNPVHEIE